MSAIEELVAVSRHYGADPEWVIAGGGNTSVKDGSTLWIKASGTTLGTITAEQFVAMDRGRLDRIWNAQYSTETEAREAEALADLMDARSDREGGLRPSVETMMHALFPHRFVVHTHPTVVNGLTCARDGAAVVARLFGTDALWIPTINPGYTLAVDMHRRVAAYRADHGVVPEIVIMQNHGLVVASETVDGIHALHERVVAAIGAAVNREPEMAPLVEDSAELRALAEMVAAAQRAATVAWKGGATPESSVARAFSVPELTHRAASPAAFAAVASAFSPDHIVYSGHAPCFVDGPDLPSPDGRASATRAAIDHYLVAEGAPPKIVVIPGSGAVAITPTERKTHFAQQLFLDTLKVAAYAESFGGSLFMPRDQIDFVRNWEVEKFREKQSTG